MARPPIRTRRLLSDLKDFYAEETHGISLQSYEDDLSSLNVRFLGLVDTEFETGKFDIVVKPPEKFPFKGPEMFFQTKVWHPNVCASTGRICMDFLDIRWDSGIVLKECVEAARYLLKDPNPRSPLNFDAAILFEDQEDMYWATAKAWTRIFADGTLVSAEVDSKISILQGLGLPEKEALKVGTKHLWNMEGIVRLYRL